MTDYSDDLVELGNQAWILNCALAELYRFRGCVERQIQAEPQNTWQLQQGASNQLDPAIARLTTRLQALMAKWTRRMGEQAALEPPLVQDEAWGCRVELPAWVRQRIRVDQETMTLAEAEATAARHPEQFFVFHDASGSKGADAAESARSLTVIRFHGVPLNVARMWWGWVDRRHIAARQSPRPRPAKCPPLRPVWRRHEKRAFPAPA